MHSLPDLFRVFLRIGLLSFGGPAAQIAVMHKELVEDRSWLTEAQFLSALSFCMVLPGPEAMQLATYAGWRLRGWPGGLIGGLLFVLPGALIMFALGLVYIVYGHVPLIAALFVGIQATVVVVVLQALLRLGKKALKTADRWAIAGLSFLGIFVFAVPFPLIIAAAAAYGAITAKQSDLAPVRAEPGAKPLRTLAIWGGLWAAPVLGLALSGQTLLTDIAVFFSKLAVVTFGGAYAVLAYMTQEVVQDHGWLTTAQMMDGLGLAETTPGPLILVTQFVGMVAGAGAGGVPMALVAGALTLWVTFIPCFLWIFLGAPYIEAITSRPRLNAALSSITAAVVGVVLNLSVWFAAHVFFAEIASIEIGPMTLLSPNLASLSLQSTALAILAGVLLFRTRLGLGAVLAFCAGISASLGVIL